MCINIQAVTAYHRDRLSTKLLLCSTPPFRQPQHCTATASKAVTAYHRDRLSTIIALFNPAVLPRLANLKHFQRRNLQWLSATGGTWSGSQPQALSRCRLLQRKYQRIASPMRKHRHNAPLYCPYIRLQESYLPSFHHLYRRQ